jgi:hypothetical protein
MSSRAKRGICFFATPKKKANSSGNPRPRNDTIEIFPQRVQPRLTKLIDPQNLDLSRFLEATAGIVFLGRGFSGDINMQTRTGL